jgi:chitodextrinase
MEIGGLRCGEISWKERGGIMNGERDAEGGKAQNCRQNCLCDTKIWKGLQNTTVTGVVATFMKQEIIM